MSKKYSPKEAWGIRARSYSKLTAPNRPSPDDILTYNRLISRTLKNKKKAKVLVMGSTPEIRDFLRTLSVVKNINVICLDISSDMYQVTSLLVGGYNPKEKYVQGNWLGMPFKDNYFDLVLGDEVICNIDVKNHDKLFSEVVRVLKRYGYWITKHNFYLKNKYASGNALVNMLIKQARELLNGETTIQQVQNDIFVLLAYRGLKGKQTVKVEDVLRCYQYVLKKALKKGEDAEVKLILKKVYDEFVNLVGPSSVQQWHFLTKEGSEKELKRHFVIKNIFYSQDYSTVQFSPIYLLLSKK